MSLALAYEASEADLWLSRVDWSRSEEYEAASGRLHWGLSVVGPSASLVLPLAIRCNSPPDSRRTTELRLLPTECPGTDGCASAVEFGRSTTWCHLRRASTVWVGRQVSLRGSSRRSLDLWRLIQRRRWLCEFVEAFSCGKPDKFCLRLIQLQPVRVHPATDFHHTDFDSRCCGRHVEITEMNVHLVVVCVHMRLTVVLYHDVLKLCRVCHK